MMLQRRLFAFFCAAMFMTYAGTSYADIDEVQQLRFGTWSITNNSSVHSITVNTDGSYSADTPLLVMISPPQEGIYSVDGLPPNTSFPSVDVTMTQPMTGTGGPDFIVDDFTTFMPDSNGAGETTLTLGATAKTSGTNQGYEDDTYEGELNIDINL
jgi:hypothetical protein